MYCTDYAEQIDECAKNVERLGLRRDDEAVAARQWLTAVLARMPLGVEDARRATLLLDTFQQILVIGEHLFRGVEPIAHAVNLAREIENDDLLRKTLSNQGVLFSQLHNLHDACVCFAEAWEIAQRLPTSDYMARFSVLLNFGGTLQQGFMYDDALVMLKRAEEVAIRAGDITRRAMVLHMIATRALDVRDFETGLGAMLEAIDLLNAPKTMPDTRPHAAPSQTRALAISEALCARLLLEGGRTEAAKESAALAQSYARDDSSVLGEPAAQMAQGLIAIYEGRTVLGRQMVVDALRRSRGVPGLFQTQLLNACAAFERLGESDQAVAHHREFVMMVERFKQSDFAKFADSKLFALSSDPFGLVTRVAKQYGGSLREAYVASVAGHADGGEAYLLSQAIKAEVEYQSEGAHAYCVGSLSRRLAEVAGLDDTECTRIEMAARLHDLGMCAVPSGLKVQRWALAPEEQIEIEKHCIDGAELVSRSDVEYRAIAAEVIRHHHERWDGSGYPDGLIATEIPIAARIVALGDTFDSMTHARAYKHALTPSAALSAIRRELGKQFDPELGALFISMVEALTAKHADLDVLLGAAARRQPLGNVRLFADAIMPSVAVVP